jgi:hypothetical protein
VRREDGFITQLKYKIHTSAHAPLLQKNRLQLLLLPGRMAEFLTSSGPGFAAGTHTGSLFYLTPITRLITHTHSGIAVGSDKQ